MQKRNKNRLLAAVLVGGLIAAAAGCGGKKESVPRLEKRKWATDFYAVDVTTTATFKRWIPGSKPLLPQKELKRRIAEEVGGKKALYVIASVVGDRVASTVVEMVLDPEPMVLYGLVERDTELGLHLRKNPITSINYHREFPNDWNQAICFQIRGRATLHSDPSADGKTARAVKRFHELYTVSDAVWLTDETRAAAGKLLAENMIIFTVPVEQLVYHNGSLPYENYNMRQLWSRRW